MQAGAVNIKLMADIMDLQSKMRQAERLVGGTMTSIAKAVNVAKIGFMGLMGGFSASQMVGLVDGYTKFTAQLKLASSSASEYAQSLDDVRRISRESQADLAATGVLYARIANGTAELGIGQAKVAQITETVNLALRVSGATSAESASAMLQLSQAFASGALRGEEFNAVNEAAPRLMKALADGMGVPVGALKDMASNGKITAQVMSQALPRALSDLRKEAESVQSIGGAFTVLKNNVLEFVGVQAQASGSVSVLTKGVMLLADNLGLLAGVMMTIAAAKFGQWIAAITTTLYAQVAAGSAATAATLAKADADVVATGAAAALATARVTELRAAVLAAGGTTALTITTNGLIPAQARAVTASAAHAAALAAQTAAMGAASVAGRVLAGALAFFGGPIGLIITALGLAATAWAVWGKSSADANKQAAESTEASTIEVLASLEKQNAKLRERITLARAGNTEAAKSGGPAAEKLASTLTQINSLKDKGAALTGVEQIHLIELQGVYDDITRSMGVNLGLTTEVAAIGQQSKAAEWMEKLASKTEKMNSELEKARKELGAAFSPEIEKRIRAQYDEKAKGAGAAAAAIKKELSAYASLSASIRTKIEESKLELAIGNDSSEAQKIRIKLDQEIAAGKVKMTATHRAALDLDLAALEVSQKAQQYAKDEIAFYAEQAKAHHEASGAAVKTATEEAEKNEELARTFGLTKTAIEALELARLEERRAQIGNIDECTRETAELEALIDAKKRSMAAVNTVEALEATKKSNDAMTKDWDDTVKGYDDIFRKGFAGMVNGGTDTWRAFAKSTLTTFKTGVVDQIYKMFAQPFIVKIIGSLLGVVGGSAAPGFANAATDISGGSMMGAFSAGKGIYDAISGGFANLGASVTGQFSSFAVSSVGQSMGLSTVVEAVGPAINGGLAPTMNMMTESASGMASAAGTFASYAGAAMAGIGIGSAIAGDKVVLGVDGTSAAVIGAAIGSIFGPVGTLVGGVIGGVVNAAFGMGAKKSTGEGIRGTLSASAGASAQNYNTWAQEGGWFRSDKSGTEYSGVSSDMQKYLDYSVVAITSTTKAYASAIGLSAQSVDGYTKAIDVSLAGLDGAGQKAAIDAALGGFGVSMAETLLGAFAAVKEGETASTTLARLATSLVTVNATFDALGQTLMATSLAGADAASRLIDVFGGVEKFAQLSASYYENFHSEEERRLQTIKQINAAAAGSGLDAATATRETFRKLVEAQDVTTASGQKTYAMLLNVAGAFAGITPAVEGAVAGISEALRKLQGDTASLQIELMRAQGNTAGANAAQYTIDTAGLTDVERAVFDYNAVLRAQIAALEGASAALQTAVDTAKQNADAAYSALERSVNAEKAIWQARADVARQAGAELQGVFDLLQSSVQDLYDQTRATAAQSAAKGQGFISQALAAAQTTGYMPDQQALASAIGAVRGSLDASNYATANALDADRLILAGKLTQLQEVGGVQLTAAQLQLKAAEDQIDSLDGILANARSQLDALNGINTSILTIPDALSAFSSAIISAISSMAAMGNPAKAAYSIDDTPADRQAKVEEQTGVKVLASDSAIVAAAKVLYQSAGHGGASTTEYNAAAAAVGGDIASAVGWDGSQAGIEALRAKYSFAVGTNYVPRDMIAQIHEGEAIVPRAYNPAAGGAMDSSNDTAALVRAIGLLEERLARIESNTGRTATHAKRTSEVLDGAARGELQLETKVVA